jgi:hypothetical protein
MIDNRLGNGSRTGRAAPGGGDKAVHLLIRWDVAANQGRSSRRDGDGRNKCSRQGRSSSSQQGERQQTRGCEKTTQQKQQLEQQPKRQ